MSQPNWFAVALCLALPLLSSPAVALDNGAPPTSNETPCIFNYHPIQDFNGNRGFLSARISAGYYPTSFPQASLVVFPGTGLLTLGDANDQITTVFVPQGCSATVWKDPNYTGEKAVLATGYWELSGMNDSISSLTCSCSNPRHEAKVQFNGSTNFAEAPDATWFDGGNFTVSAWVNPSETRSWSRILDFGNGPWSDNIILAASHGTTGRPYFSIVVGSTEQQIIAPNALPLNEWTHVAATFASSGVATLYVNGEQVARTTGWAAPRNVTRLNNYIGKSNWSADALFHGSLADVQLWPLNVGASRVALLASGADDIVVGFTSLARWRVTTANKLVDTSMSGGHKDGTWTQ